MLMAPSLVSWSCLTGPKVCSRFSAVLEVSPSPLKGSTGFYGYDFSLEGSHAHVLKNTLEKSLNISTDVSYAPQSMKKYKILSTHLIGRVAVFLTPANIFFPSVIVIKMNFTFATI